MIVVQLISWITTKDLAAQFNLKKYPRVTVFLILRVDNALYILCFGQLGIYIFWHL